MFRFWSNNILIHFASIAVISAILQSCNSKPAEDVVSTKFESIESFTKIGVDTTTTLFASYLKPDCHLQLNFEIPNKGTSSKTLEATKKMIIALTQDGAYSDKDNDINDMVKQYTKSYIMNYLEEGNDAISNYGDNIEDAANWMSYEETCSGNVLYNSNGFFSYSVKLYSYTGGAHGNSNNRVATLDLNKRKVLSLETLFESEKFDDLQKEVVDRISKDYQLLSDEIDLTDNFYLSDKGVSFIYNPFEIAAYSEGEIEVTIPWSDIIPLLSANNPILSNPIIN